MGQYAGVTPDEDEYLIPPPHELDDASRDLVDTYLAIRERRLRLVEQEEDLKEQLRRRLGRGTFAHHGRRLLRIRPNLRWDEEKARRVLPPQVAAKLEVTTLDRDRAVEILTDEVYRQCQTPHGKDVVRPVEGEA